jgi:biotin-(acetyl-CoA carboxylase) ligase
VKRDPERVARGLVARRPRDGVVYVQDPLVDAVSLRFSAVAACGSETPLLLAIIAAFSASEGVRKDTGIISWVRWPNAVTIEGRVVASSSAAVTRTAQGSWAQLDFRVNLLPTAKAGATSLYDELGVEVDSGILLEKILESLSWLHFGWSNGMHAQMLRRVVSMTETIGTKVLVRGRGAKAAGSVVDIDALGRLTVQLAEGGTKKLEAPDELLDS